MRNYQRKKNNEYILPHNIYMQTLYIIRDYERMKEERQCIIIGSPPYPDGQPTGKGKTGNPTERKAIRASLFSYKIKAIDDAILHIPQEYRKGVWNNIIYHRWFPIDADVRTYQRYKQRFIYYVAENLNFT